MKKTTKFLISLTSAVLMASNALALTGCGGGSVSGAVTGDVEVTAYDGSEVTISFYHCMGQALEGILKDCIKAFNVRYPNVTVQETSFGDYPGVRDQITTELSALSAPSLAYCYPDHVALYNKSKVVLTLDDYITSDLEVTWANGTKEKVGLSDAQLADYVPFYYEEGKMYGDGKMYTLPMMKSTELLYYNATYFLEHNLKVPTTWEEMEDVCARVLEIETAKEGGLKANPIIPLGYDSGANMFITLTEQMNSGYTTNEKGNYFAFNNEENKEMAAMFREWYDKGYITTEEIFGTYTSDLFKQTQAGKTRSVMCIGSSAGASYQKPAVNADKITYPFEVGVTMIPQKDPENPTMISQGPSLCLFKKQSKQEMAAAWLFAKFITTSLEFQARFSMQNGYTCAIQSVLEDTNVYASDLFLANVQGDPILENKELGIKAYGNDNLQAACVQLTMNYKDYYFVSPAFVGSSEARDTMATLMKNVMQAPLEGKTAAKHIEDLFNKAHSTLKNKYDN